MAHAINASKEDGLMPGFDLKQINRNDQGILGAGILAFIASFLPYYGASYHVGPIHGSVSVSAWHSYAILGLLLIFAAAGITAARVFGGKGLPTLPVGTNVLVGGLAGLGTLLVILRGYTAGGGSGVGYSYGVMWGGYVLFIAGIAMTVFAFLNFKASGEKIAWDSSAMPKSAPTAGAPGQPQAPYGNAVPYPPAAPYGSAPAAPYGSAPAAPYGSAPAAPYGAPAEYPPAEPGTQASEGNPAS
jgi:hypothetical protein